MHAQCLGMRTFTDLPSVPSRSLASFTDQLRLAVAAYLARFQGSSRYHTESDLRCYLAWCADRSLDPLAARRPHLELYIRWMQEIRRFKPSTVSRRFSVTAGFYRTCVIDGLLEHSPAEHVRRPSVPPESPTLGFTHLEFEALLTAARESPNPFDFALVAMLGLLGLRIFEATGADVTDLGEEHGHRVLRVCGKGTKVVLVPLPPSVGRAIDTAIGTRARGPILLNSRGTRMDRHAATRRLRYLAGTAGVRIARPHPHMLRHLRDHRARRGSGPAGCPDRCPPCRSAHHDALRPRPQESRPPPELHPCRLHGVWDLSPGLAIATDAYTIECMAGLYQVEIEPEVRSWLASLANRDFGRVDFLVGLLAEHAEDLGEPYTRHLGGKTRELRFHLLRQQTRVTYWLAPRRRVILLTVFRKTRSAETAEVARALRAQEICESTHGTAHEVFDREVT
jgi:integrase/recombinase XerD